MPDSVSPPASLPASPRVSTAGDGRRVALVTLGCARNEVDSEELAGRLADDGWEVTTASGGADVVLVNTCGFVADAKQESIDTLLAAADPGAGGAESGPAVVAAGCLAERYGRELAVQLPEAAAVLSFDDYPQISDRLSAVLAGERPHAHLPRDRRELLPLAPVARRGAGVAVPGHATAPPVESALGRAAGQAAGPVAGPPPADLLMDGRVPAHLRSVQGPVLRRRLGGGPVAALKLASGCDRRCAFCAIPTFRGAFVSRTPDELLAEAQWLAGTGVRELVLVSENSTSYGKDLGDPRALEKLLPQLAAVDGIVRVRVSYLQPAELRPGLVEAIATTPGVAPYFDLSFQHASEPVLRRMRRFGSTSRFLDLLDDIRQAAPEAGTRSNVIVGFPGETRADIAELVRFLEAARLDAIGVFAYSDEDGTEAADLPGKITAATIRRRYAKLLGLSEELCAQRADERVGSTVEVLVDGPGGGGWEGSGAAPDGAAGSAADGTVEGRAAHQAPEVDGSTTLAGAGAAGLRPGDLVAAMVTHADGVDLVAVPIGGSVGVPVGARVVAPAGVPVPGGRAVRP